MKIGKFSPAIFSKNSVKSTFSVKSYTKVDEKILQWGKNQYTIINVCKG